MDLAPIILFVYNRPEHTLKTLEALSKNILAPECKLYIFSDGVKNTQNASNLSSVNRVREIIKQNKWCKEVVIVEQKINKGLAASIKTGVTEIVEKYGSVIVLEDDLITSPYFLNYMNAALNFYQNYLSVFSISAYTYPLKKMEIPRDYNFDVFVGLRNSSWGWATWKNRWEKIDWNVSAYNQVKEIPAIKEALNRGGDDVFDLLEMQQTGKLNIWSIQFTIAHFINHAVSIIPTKSYVNNIGHDGSGENCHISTSLQNLELNTQSNPKFLDILYQDKRIINAFYNVNCRTKRPLWQKIINKICRLSGRNNYFVIKKKIYE